MSSRPVARAVQSPSFVLLAETMLVGVVVAVASLPLVTALPALAAGGRHLRRHLAHRDDSVRSLLGEVRRAVAHLWLPGVALPALLGVLAFNVWFVTANAVPGGQLSAALTAMLMAGVVVVALRLAGSWTDEEPWRSQVRDAVARATQDVAGSALLAAAVGIAVVLVWMLPPLAVIVGGLLAFAALAVESRRVRTPDLNERTP